MNSSRNLWPLGILLAFGLFISGTTGLVILACSHKVDLVAPDYYEQEVQFQKHLDGIQRSRQLGASIAYEPAAQRIRICLPKSQNGQEIVGSIQLYRPSAAGLDRQISLQPNPQGIQFVDARSLRGGLWKVRVAWKIDTQQFYLDETVVIAAGSV